MRAKPETIAWQRLREQLPGHAQRVENLLERGTPDVNWCWEGKEMWIELKATSPTETTRVRPEQVAWAKRRVKQRGRVVIVDRHEEAWYLWEYTIGIEFTKIGKYMTPTTLPHQKFRHAVELAAYLKGTLIS